MSLKLQITEQLVSLLEQLGDRAIVSFALAPDTRSLKMQVNQTLEIEGREETKVWEYHTSQRAIGIMPTPDHLVIDGLKIAEKVFRNIVR